MNSPRFRLVSVEWKKLGIGLVVAICGALATYLQDTIPNVDFGVWTPVVVAINSALVNFLRKLFTASTY